METACSIWRMSSGKHKTAIKTMLHSVFVNDNGIRENGKMQKYQSVSRLSFQRHTGARRKPDNVIEMNGSGCKM